jgi:hypothetical protein
MSESRGIVGALPGKVGGGIGLTRLISAKPFIAEDKACIAQP